MNDRVSVRPDDVPHLAERETARSTPADASRAGLAALDEHPKHPTTHAGTVGHGSGPAAAEQPTEQHRGRPLPYQKR